MIVFALCLATFELLKQTLTRWSFIFGYSIQIHSSGVVRQTIVSPCFSTPASEMIGITHYVSHMKKTTKKLHDEYSWFRFILPLTESNVTYALFARAGLWFIGTSVTYEVFRCLHNPLWLIYASELKFRSGRPLLVQLGPLKQEVWSSADFYNSTARSVNCWE